MLLVELVDGIEERAAGRVFQFLASARECLDAHVARGEGQRVVQPAVGEHCRSGEGGQQSSQNGLHWAGGVRAAGPRAQPSMARSELRTAVAGVL